MGAAAPSDIDFGVGADHTSARGISLYFNLYQSAAVLHDVTIVWGDGTTETATVNGGEGLRFFKHTYPRPGDYTITVTAVDSVSKVQAVKQLALATSGSFFSPHVPTRLLDTRAGIGAGKAKVGAYSSAWVKIAGMGKVPAGTVAVVLNVTVTNTTAAGHISAYPAGAKRPESSNMNYVAGQTVANQVIVPVSKDGYVELYNGGWNAVDLLADVTGYFHRSANDGYTSLAPVRFVDTREGLGAARGQVAGQSAIGVQITGRSGVPAGASAVALNVTVTNPREAGHLTVFPAGQAAPSTSSLNFAAGQTIANSVIVPVGADGKVNIRNGAWAGADVIVDVVGYYGAGSKAAFSTLGDSGMTSPWRIEDSRTLTGENTWLTLAGGYFFEPLVPMSNPRPIEAHVLNVTVTTTSGPGFLSVSPDPYPWERYRYEVPPRPPRPIASTLNWTAGKDVPNLVQAKPGPYGLVDFWNQSSREADFVIDWLGQYDAY